MREAELERIRREYARRELEIPEGFYALTEPANLYFWQSRLRHALTLLRAEELLPLAGRKVLEVGCGSGGWLPDFESLGVPRQDLAGLDLDPIRIAKAAERLGARLNPADGSFLAGADLRAGDAGELPWSSAFFDVVVQSTVFSSILDPAMRRAVAAEMLRVLRPGGAILWYDLAVNNPRNRAVQGVTLRGVSALFPDCRVRSRRITLAPPLARRLAARSATACWVVEELRVFNTHQLALIRPLVGRSLG